VSRLRNILCDQQQQETFESMLEKLQLTNFRNYQVLNLEINSPVNVFVGANGQGKTNLLEAIFYLSMLRSFRTTRLRDLKMLGTDSFRIAAGIRKNKSWREELEVICNEDGTRKLKIDESPVAKASDFFTRIRTVVFAPDDITVVNGQASQRRRFMDMFISVLSPGYLTALQQYSSALRHRNALLRTNKDAALVQSFEPTLARESVFLINERRRVAALLSNEVNQLLGEFHGKSVFAMRYRNNAAASDMQSLLQRYEKERNAEMRRGFSRFGPHLDEYDLTLGEKLLRSFGSSGQCRLISLCLKMAQVNILSSMTDSSDSLVVLVDDVSGELDKTAREIFFRVINRADQAFFTFTEFHKKANAIPDGDIFTVDNGTVKKV
jgi:DNA replication and repair protein RecF